MLKDNGVSKPIWSAIVMAREVIVFIYGRTLFLDWMMECMKDELIRSVITRFSTAYKALKLKRKGLKRMVNSTHWDEKKNGTI